MHLGSGFLSVCIGTTLAMSAAQHLPVTVVWVNEAQFVEIKLQQQQQQQQQAATDDMLPSMTERLQYLFQVTYDMCRVDGADRRVNHLGEKEIMISY